MGSIIMESFGIGGMPWIMRVYLLLFLSTIGLLLAPGVNFLNFSADLQAEIVGTATDALKVIVGAVIGSLSIAAQKNWGEASDDRSPDRSP